MSDDDSAPEPDDLLPSEAATVDAASAEGLRAQRKSAKRRKSEEDEFWRRALSSEPGRRAIWNLLNELHPFEERFACGPNGFPQSEATWFHAGEQAFGLRFYHSLVRIDRANVFRMHDEHDPRFAKPKRHRRSE